LAFFAWKKIIATSSSYHTNKNVKKLKKQHACGFPNMEEDHCDVFILHYNNGLLGRDISLWKKVIEVIEWGLPIDAAIMNYSQ